MITSIYAATLITLLPLQPENMSEHHCLWANPQCQNTTAGMEVAHRLRERLEPELQSAVDAWISSFTSSASQRQMFQRFLDRGAPYKSHIEGALNTRGLPADLYYLALIESGYNPKAISHASAAGLWQFMTATGRSYGLAINPYTDERLDPLRSTDAATRHLSDLHQRFGSWFLALAAYNAGSTRIQQAMRRSGERSFWPLARGGWLPQETADYVPKFLAAASIAAYPELYGFALPQANSIAVGAVDVPSQVTLTTLSEAAGVGLRTLRSLNPHLKQNLTPPYQPTYSIWVPQHRQEALLAAIANKSLPKQKISARTARQRAEPPLSSPLMAEEQKGIEALLKFRKRLNTSWDKTPEQKLKMFRERTRGPDAI